MNIQIIQHVEFETAGAILPWAHERNHAVQVAHPYAGGSLPAIDSFDMLILLGGPMSIHDEEALFLLKIACLYHDSGFLTTYKEHEIAGCELASKELPAFDIDPVQLEIICGMIMATRIPQTPHTKLEEVICDADLDYLGRDDFSPISHNLFLELKARNFVETENDWNLIQVRFFKQHNYFTNTNKQLRNEKKINHLHEIETSLV